MGEQMTVPAAGPWRMMSHGGAFRYYVDKVGRGTGRIAAHAGVAIGWALAPMPVNGPENGPAGRDAADAALRAAGVVLL